MTIINPSHSLNIPKRTLQCEEKNQGQTVKINDIMFLSKFYLPNLEQFGTISRVYIYIQGLPCKISLLGDWNTLILGD